ncbi:hypothetical protein BGZ80_003966 [Entomortierella chlamydospora]|uniref:CRAL-TRIO domain-containing protein n=1 Tax=Entomortierella chlamydospora TaxID=101097 RepID=A0A9P6MND8_9FUNG|nr:hypothetical protein BGZ79_000530 [Entomortierella chlamydospora]KAG0008009.1 hypothetical protein BGZ80_003966 [Entomortierella chlamydospora]
MNSAEATTNSLLEAYLEHMQQITELQHLVQQQYPPQHPSHDFATNYLNDRITLFRFLKKANYILPEAYNLVEANVSWRLGSDCDRITPRDLEENQLWTNGLVELRGQDRYGHPLITIRLGRYIPAPQQDYSDLTDENGEERDRFLDYKRYIIFVLECTRKLLWESSRRQPPEEHALQATLILDLQGTSVSDLDHQLISYTIELLKHRYPSCIAQVYVLNYSWVFGGIWQMLKRALPETARARVSFPSSVNELHEHFDLEELAADFGGLDTYQFDPETCEAFHYFGYPTLSLQAGTPTSSLSRVNSCDSIYFDATSTVPTPHHSPGLRPHEGLNFLSMTPMMPMAPPSSGNNGQTGTRPTLQRARSNSIPHIDLNAATGNLGHKGHQTLSGDNKSTPMKASLLKHSKSSAHIPSFMVTPSIEADLPTQYPISRRDRSSIIRRSGVDPNNPRGGRFYRMIIRPNSIFMKIAATQQGVRQKVVKVIKSCADKVMRTDMKTLLYWVMALIMLRGEVWHLVTASALKVLTIVGEGDDLLVWTEL